MAKSLSQISVCDNTPVRYDSKCRSHKQQRVCFWVLPWVTWYISSTFDHSNKSDPCDNEWMNHKALLSLPTWDQQPLVRISRDQTNTMICFWTSQLSVVHNLACWMLIILRCKLGRSSPWLLHNYPSRGSIGLDHQRRSDYWIIKVMHL